MDWLGVAEVVLVVVAVVAGFIFVATTASLAIGVIAARGSTVTVQDIGTSGGLLVAATTGVVSLRQRHHSRHRGRLRELFQRRTM